jgi:phytoene dehydrogenase-like protein
MGPDKELTHKEISKFNRKDADNHPKYEEMLEKLAEILEPIMTMEPLDPNKSKLADIFSYLKFGWSKRRQLKKDWPELMRFFSGSASDMLNRWFESEELKTTLATDAVIGANASPSTPGTSYVLFHHVMGECNGVKGVWGYMRGGMGGLSQSIARSCASLGVDIFTNAFVEKIIIKNNIAIGVVVNGNEVYAKQIASNATPKVTFEKLIQPAELPDDFLKNIRHINYDSASIKINLALSELPNFSATPGLTVGPQHMGTIHICPDMQYIENAYAESVSGKPSSAPILECSIPTSVDNTLAPSGKHVMNIFSQYAPFNLKTGTSWDQEKEERTQYLGYGNHTTH